MLYVLPTLHVFHITTPPSLFLLTNFLAPHTLTINNLIDNHAQMTMLTQGTQLFIVVHGGPAQVYLPGPFGFIIFHVPL